MKTGIITHMSQYYVNRVHCYALRFLRVHYIVHIYIVIHIHCVVIVKMLAPLKIEIYFIHTTHHMVAVLMNGISYRLSALLSSY